MHTAGCERPLVSLEEEQVGASIRTSARSLLLLYRRLTSSLPAAETLPCPARPFLGLSLDARVLGRLSGTPAHLWVFEHIGSALAQLRGAACLLLLLLLAASFLLPPKQGA